MKFKVGDIVILNENCVLQHIPSRCIGRKVKINRLAPRNYPGFYVWDEIECYEWICQFESLDLCEESLLES